MLTKTKEELAPEATTESKPEGEEKVGPKVIDKRLKDGFTRMKAWQKVAKEDYAFCLGDQWTTEERSKLTEEGRPCMTYNKIEPLVDLISGHERENSARIRVFPEGGEDKIFSEIGDLTLKQIDKWTKLGYKLDLMFDDGMICGKGWIEMAIGYDDDIIHGDLIFRHLTPYQVVPDPDGREYDQSDWQYIIKVCQYTKARLMTLYPDKRNEIEDLVVDSYVDVIGVEPINDQNDNYHLGKDMGTADPLLQAGAGEDKKFHVKEYWHKKKIKKYFVFNVNENRLERFDEKEKAQARADEIQTEYQERFATEAEGYSALAMNNTPSVQQNPPKAPAYDPPKIKIYERYQTEMWYAASVADIMLVDDTKSPFEPYYHGFPIFNFFAKWRPSADSEDLKVKGMVRNLKDPQRDINKSRSQNLHILNTSANSGWVGDDAVLTPEGWNDLKRMGSTPGIVIRKQNPGQLDKIEATGNGSQGQMLRAETAFNDIKEISGVNSDLLAMSDKNSSGRAIALRIKQAITILVPYFRNFRYTKEMVGSAVFAMLPSIFDVDQLKKVVGQKYMEENKVNEGQLAAFLTQIADGKFDIDITEADNSSTIRAETFDNLMEMAKNGMPIPPDVILQFSNIPNLDAILEKIQAYATQQAGGGAAPGASPAPAEV
jgi:hypothetical protein